MTIPLSPEAFWELFDEELEQSHPSQTDTFGRVFAYPTVLGDGYRRSVDLQDGIKLAIAHNDVTDDTITEDILLFQQLKR